MGMGALSSLGIGSGGTLSYDVIDQLKEADRKSTVKPIEKNIVENEEKKAALAKLRAEIASFDDAISGLSSTTLFANRDLNVTGDSVRATVQPGVDVQQMNVEVQQLATSDVYQSGGFARRDSYITTENSTIELTVGDSTYSIDVTPNTTLDDLRTRINDIAGESVTASIINTGQDQPYQLIIRGDETGEKNSISINTTEGSINTDFTNIQEAQDAKFKYNGIDISRASNEVDDLIQGVHLSLVDVNEPGRRTSIEVVEDTSGLQGKLEEFVETYNSLNSKISELTKFEEETGESGVFQGESTINRLRSDLSSIITYTSSDRSSLQDFGIERGEDGKLSFNADEFQTALNEGTEKMEQFFLGSYETIAGEERLIDGVFTQFKDTIDDYTDFSTGIFKYFGDQLDSESRALNKERTTAIERLDQRFQTMASRFAAYDGQIANMQSSFESLQMQIQQQINAK